MPEVEVNDFEQKRRFWESLSGQQNHHDKPCFKRADSESTHLIDALNEADNVQSLIELLSQKQQQQQQQQQQQNDDLANSWESLSDFDDYHRQNEEAIMDYLTKFDEKYQQLSNNGITLSSEVLALKILSRARLSKQERLRIMNDIDFTQRNSLYTDAKRALKRLGEHQVMMQGFREKRCSRGSEPNENSGKYYLILDSACSSTLCGKKWLDSYLEYLGEGLKDELEYNRSGKSFIFGGGEPVKSMGCCYVPAVLAGKVITIEVDVVPNDLPLIYSLSDMKKAQIRLDFTNDTAEIFGQIINLKMTDSGHYSVPIDEKTFWRRSGLRQLSLEIKAIQDEVESV